jgi:hypothetical protein
VEQRLEVLGDYMQRLELQPMQVVEAMLQMVARDVPCSCGLALWPKVMECEMSEPELSPFVGEPQPTPMTMRERTTHSDYCNRWGALVRARERLERVADEWWRDGLRGKR